MKILLSPMHETELEVLLSERAAHSAHTLVSSPEEADFILLAGSFGLDPQHLLDHPLYRAYPDKCAVYSEDGNYLPLAPGVYCSAVNDESSRVGRVFSYSYISASGRYSNPFVTVWDTEKPLLFSFQGGSTSLLRKRMFNLTFDRSDVLIENTSTYYHWDLSQPNREERQRRYAQTIASSRFVLCPRGAGSGTIRLFEVMQAGVAPVLISDDYLLPAHVPWDNFLIRIAERDIARLPELLDPYAPSAAERGQLARQAWLDHFAPEKEFDAMIAAAHMALKHGPPTEAEFRRRQRTSNPDVLSLAGRFYATAIPPRNSAFAQQAEPAGQNQISSSLHLHFDGELSHPLSVVAGDFDEDGIGDLALGYALSRCASLEHCETRLPCWCFLVLRPAVDAIRGRDAAA
ncbi:MAG TPA: exostosin family protein [Edaphobacter sp.]|nr:exostosin family protein [Edaphobacter sp.]